MRSGRCHSWGVAALGAGAPSGDAPDDQRVPAAPFVTLAPLALPAASWGTVMPSAPLRATGTAAGGEVGASIAGASIAGASIPAAAPAPKASPDSRLARRALALRSSSIGLPVLVVVMARSLPYMGPTGETPLRPWASPSGSVPGVMLR